MTVGNSDFAQTSHLFRRDVDTHEEVPHQMTGVDKLRAEGYYGSGLRVAVVDTGIDYKHPALGGCFGEGCLVEFGYDLINDVNDPYTNCNGHGNQFHCTSTLYLADSATGTHVSGLIAAQSNPYNFTGVAPKVTLGHYKVSDCVKGGGSTAILMQAFKMAYEAKADIITTSIGGYSGWSEGLTSRTIIGFR